MAWSSLLILDNVRFAFEYSSEGEYEEYVYAPESQSESTFGSITKKTIISGKNLVKKKEIALNTRRTWRSFCSEKACAEI